MTQSKSKSTFDEIFNQIDKKAEVQRKNMFKQHQHDTVSTSMDRSQITNIRDYKKVCKTCKEADSYLVAKQGKQKKKTCDDSSPSLDLPMDCTHSNFKCQCFDELAKV